MDKSSPCPFLILRKCLQFRIGQYITYKKKGCFMDENQEKNTLSEPIIPDNSNIVSETTEEQAIEAPSKELILGKFKSIDELTKAYEKLEKFKGQQAQELGKLRQDSTIMNKIQQAWDKRDKIYNSKDELIAAAEKYNSPEYFQDSAFREIYFFDNIEFIADNSFPYNITTYHINAALAPRYQAVNNSTYYADCVDRLITTGDKKRIIFFAGCSTAYGINSPMVQAAAGEDYAVCNLGVNGDINGAFQLEVILHYISEGDILVHTPEVMSAPQLMSSFYLDGRAFIMCEGNYDLLSIPDFSESDLIFRAYMHYVTIRNNEQECSYTDGRSEDFNIYGDYIYPRPYVEENESERDVSYSANAYNFTPEMLTEDGIEKLTSYYDDAVAKGAKVCISYSPTNGSSQTDVPVEEAAEAFDKRFRTLLSSFGYSLISDYSDYIFEGRYFYDSDYHLNELGAILRTGQLLEDLQASGIIELGI